MRSAATTSSEEAQLLASSMQQSFVRLRTGQPGKLPPPVEGYRENLPPQLSGMLDGVLSATAIGTRDQVREQMNAFVERTQADALIIAGSIYDHEARKRANPQPPDPEKRGRRTSGGNVHRPY